MLKDIIKESSLSRIWRSISNNDSGTITAYRSARDCNNGKPFTRKENEKNNAILKAKLLKKGYGVTSIQGIGIENYKSNNEIQVKEQSFIVIDLNDSGKLKEDLIKLGSLFEQDSITFSQKGSNKYILIGTNDCPNGYPGKNKEVVLGNAKFGKSGEFFSNVNGRPFVFESFNSYSFLSINDYFPTELRSINTLVNEDIIK